MIKNLTPLLFFLTLIFLTSCGCNQREVQPNADVSPVPKASAGEVKTDAVTTATAPAGGEYKRLEQELHIINLVNSLHLTEDQMKAIIPVAEESGKIREDLNRVMNENYGEVTASMKDLQKRLLDYEDATDEQQKRLDKCSMPIYRKIAENKDKTRVLAGKIRSILNINQREILLTYEPCVVPQQRDSQPERIGGYSGGENFAENLDEARKMKDADYKKYRGELLEKQRILLKTFNTPQQIESVLAQMGKALDEARKLNDIEYEIKRSELSSIDMPSRVKPGDEMEEEAVIIRYLLNPYVKKILTYKLENRGKKSDGGYTED